MTDSEQVGYIERTFNDPKGYVRMLTESFDMPANSLQISQGKAHTRFECFWADNQSIRVGRTRIEQSEFIEFAVPKGYTLFCALADGSKATAEIDKMSFGDSLVYRIE